MYLRICMDVYLLVSICFWIEAGGGRHRGPVSTCRGAAAGLWSIALLLIAFKWGWGDGGGWMGGSFVPHLGLTKIAIYTDSLSHQQVKCATRQMLLLLLLRTFLWSTLSTIMDGGQCAQRVHVVVQFILHCASNDNVANWHVSRFTPDIIIDQLLWQTLNIFWWWWVDDILWLCAVHSTKVLKLLSHFDESALSWL